MINRYLSVLILLLVVLWCPMVGQAADTVDELQNVKQYKYFPLINTTNGTALWLDVTNLFAEWKIKGNEITYKIACYIVSPREEGETMTLLYAYKIIVQTNKITTPKVYGCPIGYIKPEDANISTNLIWKEVEADSLDQEIGLKVLEFLTHNKISSKVN